MAAQPCAGNESKMDCLITTPGGGRSEATDRWNTISGFGSEPAKRIAHAAST